MAFLSQSMVKSITGILIGIAVSEGAIRSVDDPAETVARGDPDGDRHFDADGGASDRSLRSCGARDRAGLGKRGPHPWRRSTKQAS